MYKRNINFQIRRCVILGFIFGIFIVSTFFQNSIVNTKLNDSKNSNYDNPISNIEDIKNQGTYYQYYTQEWLKNGNFTSGVTPWTNVSTGDKTDIKASYSNGAANYELIGNSSKFTLVEKVVQSSQWTLRQNPNFPVYPEYPDGGGQTAYEIRNGDFFCRHEWNEGPKQTPSVQWYHNFQLPVNISDYEITSLSIYAIVNATVSSNIDCPGETPVGSDNRDPQGAVYDNVRFYISIADPTFENVRELAFNKTKYLGLSSQTTMPNTYMKNYSVSTMKDSLNTALTYNKKNFVIIVGFDIFCEDNCWTDLDTWTDLRIKEFSFNFTYNKKMNQIASLSWNQIGNKLIGGEETQVTSANLNFKYKINETLSNSIVPNSEIRIIINETQHSETIKLWSASTSWKDIKTGGFDVTSLIKKNVNISLSIQVYFADSPYFLLNKVYKISIDNVTLKIIYSIASSEIPTSSELYLNKEDKTQSRYLSISKGENVNITVKYNDSTGFINSASVNLTGYGTPKALYEDSIRKQYNITISTNSLAYGENYLKVTATKPLYLMQEISFTLNVIKRDTYLDVYINKTNIDSFTYYNCSIKQYLNITAFYRDSLTNNYITEAEVLLIEAGVGIPHALNPHPTFSNQYYITYLSDDLGKGISFLQVTAEKDNYTKATADFSVFVTERATNMKVLVNGTTPPTKTLLELEDTINITANFTDAVDLSYILTANVSILGGFYGNLTRIGNLYNIILFGKNLTQQGINFLTIYVYKANYQPQSYTFVVEVIQRQTNLHIFFDVVNVTNDPSTAPLPIGKSITIIVNYFDKYNSVINANVRLILGSISYQLAEDPITHRYSTTINTISLGIGISIPSIIAERVNYQAKTENLRIQVRKINTLITTDDEEDTITVKPGEKVKIKIEVKNLDFGGKISDCEVTYDWKYGNGDLDEDEDGVYDFSLENVPEGTHKITITVYKSGGLYEFQEYEIALNVVREKGESLLYMILFIVAMVGAGGLASYFVAYYYVLKYPKPVRKVRKYRRTLKRAKTPKSEITDREKAFNESFKNYSNLSALKLKTIEKIIIPDKLLQKPREKIDVNKISKTPAKNTTGKDIKK